MGTGPNAPLLQGSDGNTLTALMLAARGGHSSVVRLLLDAGAKVDATAAVAVGISGVNDGLTALIEAAASGDAPQYSFGSSIWAKARHGVRVILMVVQHTFGGLLNFYPHPHVLVSVGGWREAEGRWISRLKYDQQALIELMPALCCDYLPCRGPEEAGDRAGTLRTRAADAPRRAIRA